MGNAAGWPLGASLIAQLVKNLPAMWEIWVGTPGLPLVGKIPWRRERLSTPVFWPGEFHGLYSPWGSKQLDMTEWLSLSLSKYWSFNNRPSNEYSGLISFRIDWYDLLAVQGIIWDNEGFEMESGEDCTTLWIYLMPLNHTLKVANIYIRTHQHTQTHTV